MAGVPAHSQKDRVPVVCPFTPPGEGEAGSALIGLDPGWSDPERAKAKRGKSPPPMPGPRPPETAPHIGLHAPVPPLRGRMPREFWVLVVGGNIRLQKAQVNSEAISQGKGESFPYPMDMRAEAWLEGPGLTGFKPGVASGAEEEDSWDPLPQGAWLRKCLVILPHSPPVGPSPFPLLQRPPIWAGQEEPAV